MFFIHAQGQATGLPQGRTQSLSSLLQAIHGTATQLASLASSVRRFVGSMDPCSKSLCHYPGWFMNIMIVVIGYDINYINLTDYKLDYNDREIGNS